MNPRPLDPDPIWLAWEDFASFAMKVYQFWRFVGPQLRGRPKEPPRARLPAEPPVPPLLLQLGCLILMRPFKMVNTSVW
eukprot:2491742-Amphidinium_carterae.1